MLSLSRGLSLALALSVSLGSLALTATPAWADDDEEEEEEDEDGGDDDGEGEEGEEEDKDQPPVTAGGLYTLKTYPIREISRPLTMTQGIAQVRLAAGTDISAKGAFETFGVNLEALYGLKDNFTILGGLTNAYNFKQFGLYFGFEGALAYDLVDFRLAARVSRNAIPGYAIFCNPPASPNEMPMGGVCQNAMASQDNLPSGDYSAGDMKFGIDIGLPFRYAIRPELAIVALQTLMTIDFNAADQDYVTVTPVQNPQPGQPQTMTLTKGNGAKPDLNPSLGIATNPIAPLSVVIFAQLRIPDFDTSAGAFQVPVTGRLQFSPNQKLDIGLEFTLLNVKPPEGQSPIDNRFLSLFVQTRVGR